MCSAREEKTFAELLDVHLSKQRGDPVILQILEKYVYCHKFVKVQPSNKTKRPDASHKQQPNETKTVKRLEEEQNGKEQEGGRPYELFLLVEGPLKPQVQEELYYKLQLDKSITENLANRIVIEYPIIHVVLPTHAHKYKVITPEQEAEIVKKNEEERQRRKEKKDAWLKRQGIFDEEGEEKEEEHGKSLSQQSQKLPPSSALKEASKASIMQQQPPSPQAITTQQLHITASQPHPPHTILMPPQLPQFANPLYLPSTGVPQETIRVPGATMPCPIQTPPFVPPYPYQSPPFMIPHYHNNTVVAHPPLQQFASRPNQHISDQSK